MKKEDNVLFNDALNTSFTVIWCQNAVKDHTDRERGNPPMPLFRVAARDRIYIYMHYLTDRIAHTIVFVTPVVDHWLEREITRLVHQTKYFGIFRIIGVRRSSCIL